MWDCPVSSFSHILPLLSLGLQICVFQHTSLLECVLPQIYGKIMHVFCPCSYSSLLSLLPGSPQSAGPSPRWLLCQPSWPPRSRPCGRLQGPAAADPGGQRSRLQDRGHSPHLEQSSPARVQPAPGDNLYSLLFCVPGHKLISHVFWRKRPS